MDQNLKQVLKSIRIVHLALIIGVTSFLLITIYLNQSIGGFLNDDKNFMNLYLLIANILSIFSVIAGIMVFKKKINKISKSTLIEDLIKYREAMIIRTATIEGPCFMFIVGFLLFGSYVFLLEAIAALFLLSIFYPGNNRIAKEIKREITEFY